jgi:hypothetical protein
MLGTAANIATIFLVIQGLIILIVLLALTVVMTKVTIELRRKVREVMPQIQGHARRLSSTTEDVSQKVAAPFVRLNASQARFHAMRNRAFAGGSGKPGSQQEATKE